MERDFIGRGWSFPVRPGPAGRLTYAGDGEKIRQSIWLIMSTAPGERQMRPDFGCGIHDLVFAPAGPATRSLVVQQVRRALVRWEPRIDVLDVYAAPDPSRPNRLLVEINYRVRATNSRFNLVYPFYLE